MSRPKMRTGGRTRLRSFLAFLASLASMLLTLLVWNGANQDSVDKGVARSAASFAAAADDLLPSRPLLDRDLRDLAWLNRDAPTVMLSWNDPVHALLGPVHVPFGISRTPLQRGFIEVSVPVAFAAILGSVGLYVTIAVYRAFALWPVKQVIYTSYDVSKTLILLLPVPLCLGVVLRFYHYLGTHHDPVLVAKTAVSTEILIGTAILMLGLYPLVFLHLRWRRALRREMTSGGSPTCPRCGYERGELATCPECGAPCTAPAIRLSRAKRRILIAGYAAFPLLLIAPFWLSWIDIAIYHMVN
jgi:hypothetical protein